MSTDLATIQPREIVITTDQTALIKHTICNGATDAEMQLFFFDCQRRGTHPLDKLIHFTKRDGKYTPVTSIDFFRLRAHSSGAYAGEGATSFELGEDGLPNTCTVAVLRLVQGQLCTWRATARWDEYYPGEKSGFMWRKMPFLMLSKCAEALALRKAFPAELQGLYVKEEMDQAETPKHTIMDNKREVAQKLQDLRDEPAREDGSGASETVALPTQQAGEAPAPADDPTTPYRRTLAACAPTGPAVNAWWGTIPESLRQDLYGDYSDALKALSKKKGS